MKLNVKCLNGHKNTLSRDDNSISFVIGTGLPIKKTHAK